MAWVRLDDGYPENPKISDLSDAAFRADVEGTCFSSRSHRDGHIPVGIAKRLWGDAITELVRAGRWHEGFGCGTEDCISGPGDGFVVHDFLAYNWTVEEAQARSTSARNAARTRWGSASPSDSAYADNIEVSSKASKNKESDEFVEFYEHAYPRRTGRGAARKAWVTATRKASPTTIIEGARRFAADPNREPAYTPHPSTWLNAERWTDDPLPSRNGRVPSKAMPYHQPFCPECRESHPPGEHTT